MLKSQVARQIAEGLSSAGATGDSVYEAAELQISDIAPYPALFRAEIQRRFGIRLQQTDLNMTIDELALLINQLL